ncbi:16S rRNA (guanine(966)-N(2))-methyltransferase RsmD [bacterium D16-51]|nr:16S rRNA (guanine(966)-N(2))-methyltransferase RsmD [bacterium D16-59]RKI62638.1 16S rRNA (guanine(966)-N(2))-methyltransferase RsmD [bacterium D16-51]
MRVIAGAARGRKLVCPSGSHTRPTTDRIKETLFNMLQMEVPDADFLDLYSGSGGIGIEALSRGCRQCVFVENNREAVRCIMANLKCTGFLGVSEVMAADVRQALKKLENDHRAFDIIFMDPPYHKGFEADNLAFLTRSSLVHKGTLLIAETAMDTDISYLEGYPCRVERVKEYKTNRHVFLRI